MNIRNTGTRIRRLKEKTMDSVFYTLQDFFTHSKGMTYLLMGAALVAMTAMWNFLVARDEKDWPE